MTAVGLGATRGIGPPCRTLMLSVSYGNFIQNLLHRYKRRQTGAIMKATYENHEHSNVSKSGRGGETQSLAD